jgi:hypothetical protein
MPWAARLGSPSAHHLGTSLVKLSVPLTALPSVPPSVLWSDQQRVPLWASPSEPLLVRPSVRLSVLPWG